MQLFALYNHTGELNTSLRFYSLRVPLRVQKEAGLITEVDTHWLDHMTQHFTSGAQLIDGFFHLDDDNGMFCGLNNETLLIIVLCYFSLSQRLSTRDRRTPSGPWCNCKGPMR